MIEGVHVPFTNSLCSCGRTFEFETELMKHIDELMPQDTKKRQLDLFVMQKKMVHLDLFSGLGLFSYAADRVWNNLEHVFCEIEGWPYKFLKQTYPKARIERDVKEFNAREYSGTTFLLTAGVPCQPASIAGKRRGAEDDRWLWPEAIRIMAEAQPTWAIFENPLGILTLEKGLVFENLLLEMEGQGYSIQPYIIPACAIGAIHRRDRVWVVAHRVCMRGWQDSERGLGLEQNSLVKTRRDENPNTLKIHNSNAWNPNRAGLQRYGEPEKCSREWLVGQDYWQEPWPEVAAELCRVSISPSDRIHRLKALGNTIQWEVAVTIMQGIKEI